MLNLVHEVISDYEKLTERTYNEVSKDTNNISYWLPHVCTESKHIKVPKTEIYKIDLEWYRWLVSDVYEDDKIIEFNEYIAETVKKSKFKGDNKVFVKLGDFSGKFNFNNCVVTDIKNLGKNVLNIFYDSMVVGCGTQTEFALREFIETPESRFDIYNGLKLNTEFRVFYDFNTMSVIDCFNYWDATVMTEKLKGEDLVNFRMCKSNIEFDFTNLRLIVINAVEEHLSKSNLKGRWSVDIMKSGKDLWLIDMATAESSYYYDKLKKAV